MDELNLKNILLTKIKENGGWTNAHAHIDRAFTLNDKNFFMTNKHLHDKWKLVDESKQKATIGNIYDRMCQTIEIMIGQGVTSLGTFIDFDHVIQDKALKAGEKARQKYKGDITIKFISHASKGVLAKEEQRWLEIGWEFVDIIGGLPAIDTGKENYHLDILLSKAKKMGKMVHIHVDQLNKKWEKETEQLVKKTLEHGLENKVVAVHGISLAAQSKEYRDGIYKQMADAGVMVVSCPTAWIDSKRCEEMTVTHNSIAPVDELVPAGVTVGLGTDNISDIYKPFSDGDMWTELRVLLEGCRYYEIEELVKIATINGRKALGIE